MNTPRQQRTLPNPCFTETCLLLEAGHANFPSRYEYSIPLKPIRARNTEIREEGKRANCGWERGNKNLLRGVADTDAAVASRKAWCVLTRGVQEEKHVLPAVPFVPYALLPSQLRPQSANNLLDLYLFTRQNSMPIFSPEFSVHTHCIINLLIGKIPRRPSTLRINHSSALGHVFAIKSFPQFNDTDAVDDYPKVRLHNVQLYNESPSS